jgi:hypothetical protein
MITNYFLKNHQNKIKIFSKPKTGKVETEVYKQKIFFGRKIFTNSDYIKVVFKEK